MPSDQHKQDKAVLSEHLQDQFVVWFIGVMTVVYVIEHLYKIRQTDTSENV